MTNAAVSRYKFIQIAEVRKPFDDDSVIDLDVLVHQHVTEADSLPDRAGQVGPEDPVFAQ